MRPYVDPKKCIGCGLCAATEPTVFELNDDGLAEAFADATKENLDSVWAAIEGCPVDAIREHE